ncbi:unnamed protein product [Allacma fusca]|uniref:Uncharacterized protein n=1 Tax=Allacma fusca TaxID=39272 RepID=A0A8J2K020_9HEXA|nr:unnamed protein product [Allacma fusca]
MIIWLLSAIILSNGYKSFLKGSFAADSNYVTKWRFLHELVNFTLYFPTGIPGSLPKSSSIHTSEKTCHVKCDDSRLGLIYLNEEENLSLKYKHSNFLQSLSLECLTIHDLDSHIENTLGKPKTALVAFSYEFDFYWGILSQVAAKKKLRFAHNRKTLNDQAFREPVYVFIPRYIDEKSNLVLKRAKVMLGSGLFWLWEKWDRFPKCLGSKKKKVTFQTCVRPLSMESSIVLAIYALCICNLACVFVFVFEIIFRKYFHTQ